MSLARDLRKLYAQPLNFVSQVNSDVDNILLWFDDNTFARYHDINGHKVLSVLTSNIHSQSFNFNNVEGVSRASAILFMKCADVVSFDADEPLRVDGKLYTVQEAVKIQDAVWRVSLLANVS